MMRFISLFRTIGWSAYEYVAMALGLTALGVLGMVSLPLALILLALPTPIRIPTGRRLIASTMAIYLLFLKTFCAVRIDASGLRALQASRPLIIIANHPSLLDAVVLLAMLPHAACVMKGSLKRNLFVGPMTRLSGYVDNRDPMALVRRACEELDSGAQILLFPEGTRTRSAPINPFGEAAALISSRSGVAVQTLLIEFDKPYLGKGWSLFKKPSLPLRITVKPGERFDAPESRLALTGKLESYYREVLKT